MLFSAVSFAQANDEKEILRILNDQTKAWNRGKLDAFMVGYWESDSLMYIGKSGVTYGYSQTLANYERNYRDTTEMGKLAFDILHLKKLSDEYYLVVGKWSLKRSMGDAGGHYTLVFRKMKGKWVIVADHSS